MYYLIRPNLQVEWVDLPEQMVKSALRERPFDLGTLEWLPAERLFDAVALQLALRRGIACSKGIAIGGIDLVPLTAYEQLTALRPASEIPRPGEDLMEALIPGWKQETDRLHASIDETRLEKIAETRTELEEALAEPVSDRLREHWQSLGGILVG